MTANLDSIGSQLTPGQIIKAAREDKSLSLGDISQRLLLSKNIIAALEADDYSKIPAEVYAEGYLRAYAQALDMPIDKVIESFRRLKVYSNDIDLKKTSKQSGESDDHFKLSKLLKIQKVRLIFWSVLAAVFFGSLIFSVIKCVSKPVVSSISILEEQITVGDESAIAISNNEDAGNSNLVIEDNSSDSSVEIDIPLNLTPPKGSTKK